MPKTNETEKETYDGVEFCDLSSHDKEKANQGIIESDQVIAARTDQCQKMDLN